MFRPDRVVLKAQILLADPLAAHWSVPDLVQFVDESVRELAGVVPHEFTENITVPLTPGVPQQTLPPGYSDVAEIIGNVDTSTGITQLYSQEPTRSEGAARLRGKYQCMGGGSTAPVTRYDVVDSGRGLFTVHPVPGPGAAVSLMAVRVPPSITALNYTTPITWLADIYEPPCLNWVMSRAYEVDAESDVANDRAAYYRSRFYEDINAIYSAQSRLRTGFVLGQLGETDSTYEPQIRFDVRRVYK